ncbi:MAG: glycosyltransferase [Candidatus Micrarchaeota archaeon]
MVDVSFIVPALNEENYIERCLKSIKNQKTTLDFEIILSDGNSTDRTLRLAEKYVDRVVTSRKKGIALGRNAGAEFAKGDTLIFIDADTQIPPHYANVIHAVLSNERISGVSCAFCFDCSDKICNFFAKLSNDYYLLKGFNSNATILGYNACVRRSTFRKVKGFPNKPLEDRAFGYKLEKLGKVLYLPEPVVVTSARRLLREGPLSSMNYYAGLQAGTENVIPHTIKDIFKSREYKPIR